MSCVVSLRHSAETRAPTKRICRNGTDVVQMGPPRIRYIFAVQCAGYWAIQQLPHPASTLSKVRDDWPGSFALKQRLKCCSLGGNNLGDGATCIRHKWDKMLRWTGSRLLKRS